MPEYSYQLYSSRNFGPPPDTFAMLANAGYRAVEGFGGLIPDVESATKIRACLDETGLVMPTAHMSLDAVRDTPDEAMKIAAILGITQIFVPHTTLRHSDSLSWKLFAKELAQAGEPFWDRGMVFGWHNHDFEFTATKDGDMPLDLILADERLAFEIDIAWVARAGQDPFKWIDAYAGRITAAHVKDIAPAGQAEDEDGWADIGFGTLDWSRLIASLEGAGIQHYVAEHDNPSDDKRFAARSIDSLKGY